MNALTFTSLAAWALDKSREMTPEQRAQVAESYGEQEARMGRETATLANEVRRQTAEIKYRDNPYPEGSDQFIDWCIEYENGRKPR